MATFDAVFVGSGINSLVGAALLAREGWSVCVLERNDVAGGCIRTSTDLTLPGFTHEVLASWHPLFTGSAAYAELEGELTARGVVYVNTDLPTGTAFPDGSAAFITGSLEGNVAEFDRLAPGDGAAWERQFNEFMGNADLAFGILSTELWSTAGLTLGRKALRRLGRRGLLEFAGNTLVSCRDWVSTTFESEAAHGVLAPWVLHTGLGPDQATSGFMTQVIGAALQLGGMPVPVGGGVRLVDALAGIVTDAGGEVRLSADVRQILVANGRATGVRLTDGEVVAATRAVVANVTPTQLYGSLLGGSDVPTAVAEAAARFRYGRAEMQIHLALDEPPRWKGSDAERLARCPIVHVTPGLDGVSRAVNEAERGLLPAEATIVCGQPVALDPSRAPDGKSIIWIQLQELPAGRIKGDAAGELDTGDGTWTDELSEAYADRIVARLGDSIENLGAATLKRVVVSPPGLEALNRNLVGGDIYGGSCALDQNLLWRPLAEAPGHETAVAGLWHIGASTHPGPGPRCRLRLPRREGADEAADHASAPREAAGALVSLSLSEISTIGASFAEDVEAYAAAGFDAIGIWEFKLPPDDEANLALLAEHGLARLGVRARGPVGAAARDRRHGRPLRRRRAHRGARGIGAAVRRLRPRVRRLPRRPARRSHARRGNGSARRRAPAPRRRRARGGNLGRLRAGAPDASGRWRASSTASPTPTPCSRSPVRRRSGSCSTPTTSGTTPRCCPGSRPTSAASSASTSATGRRSTAPTASLPTEGISHTLELVAALVLAGWDGALDVEIFSTPELFWGLPVDEAARRAYAAAAPLD